jgi:hypothetical protein
MYLLFKLLYFINTTYKRLFKLNKRMIHTSCNYIEINAYNFINNIFLVKNINFHSSSPM